ncbi:MAG: ribonuclease III [Candidatus Aegiribacteria sp.]|nr:ribonuclease III [Candidatus Aegiribacteria sp.]MBD3294729.1 ribonuclease III [Candidatus Fermentibacteria bacterium]
MTGDPVSSLERIIGYTFSDRSIPLAALTHPSGIVEDSTGRDYERLEFLGDAVLELVTREYLMEEFPSDPEGVLTRRKIRYVKKRNLADHGRRLGLHHLAIVGGGFRPGDGAEISLAADLMESVIGAVYSDSGLKKARELVMREILEKTEAAERIADSRSLLQEYCQRRGMDLPDYTLAEVRGPAHRPVFTVVVSIQGEEHGRGTGPTRKAAREIAAAEALKSIERTV